MATKITNQMDSLVSDLGNHLYRTKGYSIRPIHQSPLNDILYIISKLPELFDLITALEKELNDKEKIIEKLSR